MTATARPALLLIHGFTGSGAAWADCIPAFAPWFDVIAVDLPGHGANLNGASVEATAEGLAHRYGGLHPHVLGYSLGARVALRLAVVHPASLRRLILESPSAGLSEPEARTDRRMADDQLADDIERDGIAAFVDRWERMPIFASQAQLPEEVRARQRAIRLASSPHGLAGSLRLAGQGVMTPLHNRLASIVAPTLVIVGSLDPARARAEQVAAGIPGARLTIVVGAGHTPHLERPEAFRRLALEFLQEDAAA
jgi:2-succinyl-6-hydroxy-2,4-cyclohexadiene-1-carboxylate synthase